MLERELLDKLGKLIKYKDGKKYINAVDIRNLELDVSTYCQVLEVLNRNDIEIIKNRINNNEELRNKVLKYQVTKSIKLRDEIIEECLYHVYFYASSFSKLYNIAVEELISYGSEGVMFSIDNYESNFKLPFISYCTTNIKRHIQKAVEQATQLENKAKDNVDNFYEFLLKKRINPTYVSKQIRWQINTNLINNPISLESIEFLKYDSEHSSDSCIENIDNRDLIRYFLDQLPFKERKLLEYIYGLNGDSEHTYEEVGKMNGVTRQATYEKTERILQKVKSFKS